VQLRLRGILSPTVYNRARFFSVWELKRMVHGSAGKIPVRWQTLSHLNWESRRLGPWIERGARLGKYPFGGYTGMTAVLMPRFRTRPLELEVPVSGKRQSGAVTGYGASRRATAGKLEGWDAGMPGCKPSARLGAGAQGGEQY
jgi:hypothetical protein